MVDTVKASVTSGTMKSARKEQVGTILPEGDTTWEIEDDIADPWRIEDWSEDPVRAAQGAQSSVDNSPAPYYDYVPDRRRSTLPYDHRGIAELYVEDLEFSPTNFGEYDDTEEFAT
jgi:hypothetical protein